MQTYRSTKILSLSITLEGIDKRKAIVGVRLILSEAEIVIRILSDDDIAFLVGEEVLDFHELLSLRNVEEACWPEGDTTRFCRLILDGHQCFCRFLFHFIHFTRCSVGLALEIDRLIGFGEIVFGNTSDEAEGQEVV